MTEDARLRAIIAESKRNERTNEALQADMAYKPAEWTEEQERELIERQHGDERERIDRLVSEFNEQQRRS